MRFRNSRLRTKVTALLVSLTALWAFAAWVTLREGVNLLWTATLDSKVAQPAEPLLVALQQERRLSMILVEAPGRVNRKALEDQRVNTDKMRATLNRMASGNDVKRAAGDLLERHIDNALRSANTLDEIRRAVDERAASRDRVAQFYGNVIEQQFLLFDEMANLDDKDLAADTRALVELNRTWELLGQEDALLSSVLAGGRRSDAVVHERFMQVVGARRTNYARVLAQLSHTDPVAFNDLSKSPAMANLERVEQQVIQQQDEVIQQQQQQQQQQHRTRSRVRTKQVTAQQWLDTVGPALTEMRKVVQAGGDRIIERAQPMATWVIVRLVLAGGLGLCAVIASIVVSITTARAIVQQLERLRAAAWELAEQRLPGVVERLGHGEEVDVAVEAPPLEFGDDEIGQVGKAFNAVQQTAIRVAVEQAELRRGIRDILLSLARRTQTLVRRQLSLLDVMERRELDPTELEDLFKVDHLATRMRRNAENLIVLSGATPARGWRRSVPMVDVLRAAVAEVEEYSRVDVLPVGQVTLAGRAVGDITHLLAELIENAVSFSPSYTVVRIGGHMAASGYAIEIEDRGLGMSDEALQAANAQIIDSPEFNLSSTARLGLYVVSRLSKRYGVRVSLKRSAYGGTTAIVLIPRELVIEDGETDPSEATSDTASDAANSQQAVPVGAVAVRGDRKNPQAVANDGSWPAPGAAATPSKNGESALSSVPQTSSVRTSADRRSADNKPHESADKSQPSELSSHLPVPDATHTPSGLPFRVPQASLAPELRDSDPSSAPEPMEEDVRSPEDIRKVMGAFQAGTRRGRSDAEKSLRDGDDSATPTSDTAGEP